jgi:hypothetical protein
VTEYSQRLLLECGLSYCMLDDEPGRFSSIAARNRLVGPTVDGKQFLESSSVIDVYCFHARSTVLPIRPILPVLAARADPQRAFQQVSAAVPR